jgi:hypothetical protein
MANWPPVARILMENLHEAFMAIVILYRLVMGLAVIGVINAVFMQETFKVVNSDCHIMIRNKQNAINQHRKMMEKLFRVADGNHDGRIGINEFRDVFSNDDLRLWLASMDIDLTDTDLLFDLLAGDDGAISIDELISGIAALRGTAKCLDVRVLRNHIEEVLSNHHERLTPLVAPK